VTLDGAERAIIQSRAKLAYDSVRDDQLPRDFAELAARIAAAEARRGASRVDPPEQEVAATGGGFALQFRPRLASEARNAALSLATNMAVADVLQAHGTGLFRVMDAPNDAAVKRLRQTARAFKLDWPVDQSLADYQRALKPDQPWQAAFMLAIRRAGGRAEYVPYRAGITPMHAAMAATYAHATAPLRRLADRYVVGATLAIMNGQAVPEAVTVAFPKLPAVMANAGHLGGQIDRAVIDLAETVMLSRQVGQAFPAVVTDLTEQGVRMQLCDLPIVARVNAHAVSPGDALQVRLTNVDVGKRKLVFERIG
jgi:exoribonuclease R